MLDLATLNASGPPIQGQWTVFLFGSFQLIDPLGLECKLPSRKVEGLLAVLAISRRFGINRDEAGEILWPDRPLENQRANLRQALAQLRKAIGEESIESSRSHVRLSSFFRLASDHGAPSLRRSGGFMPGHEGEWFEEFRDDPVEEQPLITTPNDSLVGRFSEDLQWLSEIDPRSMFGQLQANLATGKGIPFGNLLGLIRSAGMEYANPGWADFWIGSLEDDLLICAEHLRRALREAKRVGDLELASETALELGKVYSRTGNLEKAQKMCQIADSIAEKSKTKRARANALRLHGTFLVTWRDAREGLNLLAQTEEMTDDLASRTHLQGSRAFYAASIGLYEEAHLLLERPSLISVRLGHSSVKRITAVTRAILDAVDGQHATAVAALQMVSRQCYQEGLTQFGVYSEELLAKMFYKRGDKALAAQWMSSAKKGRQSAQMTTTWLEAKRISTVLE